ncbi:metalloregulator ArsR/SmtB family transcription factor, partial [Nguyenibacter vanlangensis]
MSRSLVIFQALADPTRLRILALLRTMELSVGEIAQVLGQSQPRVSRHVKILVAAGLAERRKEGSWVFLTLGTDEDFGPLLAAMDRWDRHDDAERAADIARLKAVRTVRAMAAEDYFETHAANWDAIRSLHVAEGDVEAAILRVLAPEPIGRLVDIGTGTGRMLELLAPRADSAVGFDRSPAM